MELPGRGRWGLGAKSTVRFTINNVSGLLLGTTYLIKIATPNGKADEKYFTLKLLAHPWPMFHHNLQHTGRSPYKGPETPTLKWSFTTGGVIMYSSPAIGSDGTIYVGSDKLYAINPNGTFKWSYTTGEDIDSSPR